MKRPTGDASDATGLNGWMARTWLPRVMPPVAGLALGLLALGPGLGRGFVLSYDMVFVPHPPLTAAALGWGGGPPRTVPNDAVVGVLSVVLPTDVVQKLVLLSIFVLACSGAAALLRGLPLLARLAAGIFYSWNPYVAERLILGQWALLFGYAGLPWIFWALGWAASPGRRMARLCLALVPAAIGGWVAMSFSAVAAIPAALAAPRTGSKPGPAGAGPLAAPRGLAPDAPDAPEAAQARWGRIATVAATVAAATAVSLPWLIPALLHPVQTTPAAVDAFAARADTPFGSFGSLLMLGGAWNAETVPRGYGGLASVFWLVLAAAGIAGYLARGRRDPRWPGLGVAALTGLLLACIGITAPGRDLLRGLITLWPGFAVLRDGQQFVAPLALAEAVGLGALVSWAIHARQPHWTTRQRWRGEQAGDLAGVFISLLVVLAPLLLLPGLAFGGGGRLRPAAYPADWLRARATIASSHVRGSVLVLPWAAYRRYGWNHGEAVLDPWSRLLPRTVIWNDAVQVGNIVIPPEDPAARRLNGLITSAAPLTAALRCAGVAYVIVDAPEAGAPDAGGSLAASGNSFASRLNGAAVALHRPDVVLYQLGDGRTGSVHSDCGGQRNTPKR